MSYRQVICLGVDGHVVCTVADHPFFTTEGWMDAGNFRAGDLLLTRDGIRITVDVDLDDRFVNNSPVV